MVKFAANQRKKYKRCACFYLLIFLILLVTGCSKSPNEISNEQEIQSITASVIEDARENCRLSNESDCSPIEIRKGKPENEEHADDFAGDVNTEDKSEKNITIPKLLNLTLACEAGWKCISKFEMAYRNSNCSFGEAERCKAGCQNDACIKTCTPGNLSCRKDALQICDDNGEGWKFYMNCAYGCENSSCMNSALQLNQTQNTTQPQNICNSTCFSITNFHYDAEGNECQAAFLNGEYVTFRNNCDYACDLTEWIISDDKDHTYVFPSFTIGVQEEFSLYSGSGTDSSSELYWNSPFYPCKAIWNNDGDTLYLKNQNGELIFSQNYT